MNARLIVNADDGGLAASTDAAILRCAREGIVGCASVVVSGTSAATFVRDAASIGIDLGLHLNLTEGRSLTGGPALLTDDDGSFKGPKQAVWAWGATTDTPPPGLVEEIRAQWQRLCELGARPTHVNGHNHVHVLPPVLHALREALEDETVYVRMPHEAHAGHVPPFPLEALCARARDRLPGRWRATDGFVGYGFCHAPSVETLLDSLPEPRGTTELMVHPGGRSGSPFGEAPEREAEVEALCDGSLLPRLEARGYAPATFRDLLREHA